MECNKLCVAEMDKLREENARLKEHIARLEKEETKVANSPAVPRRRYSLPAELVNEMFAALSLEKAFGLFPKLSNKLLARNVQKMVNGIKTAIKGNKWNAQDCEQGMLISDDGLVLTNPNFGMGYIIFVDKLRLSPLDQNSQDLKLVIFPRLYSLGRSR